MHFDTAPRYQPEVEDDGSPFVAGLPVIRPGSPEFLALTQSVRVT